MGRLDVDGQTVSYVVEAEDDADAKYELWIQAQNARKNRYVIELDARRRGDLTAESIEARLSDWLEQRPRARITQYMVREVSLCRHGSDEAGSSSPSPPPIRPEQWEPPEEPGPKTSDRTDPRMDLLGSVAFDLDSEVLYHVGGPENSVYGTATGTVEDAKPANDPPLVTIRRDGTAKDVPIAWVEGPVDS